MHWNGGLCRFGCLCILAIWCVLLWRDVIISDSMTFLWTIRFAFAVCDCNQHFMRFKWSLNLFVLFSNISTLLEWLVYVARRITSFHFIISVVTERNIPNNDDTRLLTPLYVQQVLAFDNDHHCVIKTSG